MKPILSTKCHIILCAAVSLLCVFTARAAEVVFPDANLESAVRQALAKPSGEITAGDMLSLTTLSAPGRNILDTTGLEYAANLTNLDLTGNAVTNHAGFNGLTNLLELRFNQGAVGNLAFLAACGKLQTLQIYENPIQDISPLASLTTLQWLQLDWDPVTNHSVLAGLTNLATLYLAGNGLANIDFVAGLAGLRDLGLYDNLLHDISILAGRTNLQTLQLGWNGVTNPAVLATLTGLRELTVNGNAFTNVPFLSGLTNLTGLGLDYTALVDMSPVTNLTRLSWLNVGENYLTAYPHLRGMTNLVTLMAAGNRVSDLTPLTNLPALTGLHLQRNQFHSVAALKNIPLLESLLLSGNSIDNPAEIGALTNLHSLELRDMHLTNLTMIVPLTQLRWLDIGQNEIRDLSSVTNLPWLDTLDAEENRLRDINAMLDCPALRNLDVGWNYLETNAASGAWFVITNLQARGVTVQYDPQHAAPVAPRILAQPLNRSASEGGKGMFTIEAAGGTPLLNYRWQYNGVDLIESGKFSGTDSPILWITGIGPEDAGSYSVRLWDDWTETNSAAAELLVITNVEFADFALELAVRDQLGIPSDPLTPADLASLDQLYAADYDIASLSGLEAAVNLTKLDLSGNERIANFSPLSYLGLLESLSLSRCGLDDFKRVSWLPRVTSVDLRDNFLADLEPLGAWGGLEYVWLDGNQLTGISPLLLLTNLYEVYLSYNRLDTNALPVWDAITELINRAVYVEFAPQNPAGVPPVITSQPRNAAICIGGTSSLHVEARGNGTRLNYRWLKDGVPVRNDPAPSLVHGFDSDTLEVRDAQYSDAGGYQVRVWDEFGVTYSRTATVRLIESVAFVDPKLEQAVRDRLELPTEPLTPQNLAWLDWLDAYNYGITNLSGIEAAGNLFWLSLSDNPGIRDFTPLSQLPQLWGLDLNACYVDNIDFVATLAPLEELHLWAGTFTNLSVLASQPQLKRLNLGYNSGITDFGVLNGLTGIEYLWLAESTVSNIDWAASMPHLRELDLANDSVRDLSPLAGATDLARLELNGNQATNPAPLATCTNLEWLSLVNNQFETVSFVTNLHRLTFLNVEHNPIADLAPLALATSLESLCIGWLPATNFEPISHLAELKSLQDGGNGISDVTFIAGLTNLESLALDNNQLTTLPPYEHLARLRYLNLDANPLAGIGFLAPMTNLTELYLNSTGLRDLRSLAAQVNLQHLGLAGNHIADASPLASLTLLNWVTLYDNELARIPSFAGTPLSYVDFRENLLDVFAPNPTLSVIQALQERGATVDYQWQKAGAIHLARANGAGGGFQFDIHSAPDGVLDIWYSTNLTAWNNVGAVTNHSGSVTFTHSPAAGRGFYRAQLR